MDSETELVARAAAGNREAFDELVERNRPWLYGLCFRLVRDREVAQDLVQESLLAAFRGMPHLRERTRFRAWLSRILLNNCRMYLRRTASQSETSMPFHGPPAASTSAGPEMTPIEAALDRVESTTRRLLLLFYGEGLSHRELAEVLSLSPAAVKSRLHRTREQLRKEMINMMTPEQRTKLGAAEQEAWSLRTILLVEPDEAIRLSLRNSLTAAGYEVVLLPTGEAALEAASARRGQMLILDKHCGEPNWVEALTLLQADAWCRDNLPICVFVDPENQRDRILAWQAGAQLCFTRPPSAEEVVGYVKRVEQVWSEGRRGESEATQCPKKTRRKSDRD